MTERMSAGKRDCRVLPSAFTLWERVGLLWGGGGGVMTSRMIGANEVIDGAEPQPIAGGLAAPCLQRGLFRRSDVGAVVMHNA